VCLADQTRRILQTERAPVLRQYRVPRASQSQAAEPERLPKVDAAE